MLSAAPTNEDAVDILDGMELKGTPLDVAMNAIVGSLVKNGYVDELANSILITVEDEDTARGARLQQELTSQADAVLASAQVNGAILSQTFQHNDALQQKADEYGISAGKAALIQTIADSSSGLYTFEELVGQPLNDLNLLYTSSSPSARRPRGHWRHRRQRRLLFRSDTTQQRHDPDLRPGQRQRLHRRGSRPGCRLLSRRASPPPRPLYWR